MQALICELCRGNSFSKQGDFFQCDYCRTKYSPEQAKKLLVEGSVTIDRGGEAENLLRLAETSLNHGNAPEANEGARRVLEIDPKNSRGWLLLGASRLTLGVSAPLRKEAKRELELALEFASESEREDFVTTVVDVIRQSITDQTCRMGVKELMRGSPFFSNFAAVYEVIDSNIELLKLAHRLSGDVQYPKLIVSIAKETLPRLQVARKAKGDLVVVYATQEQVDKMIADLEQSVEIVKSSEPGFKSRTPKIGKKSFFKWP